MNSEGRLDTLDGMRGVAALLVAAHHILLNGYAGAGIAGYLAVDFFFVLSGFVIARAYDRRLAGGWSMRRFMSARLLRLLPMIFVGTAAGLPLAVALVLRRHDAAMTVPVLIASTALNAFALPTPIVGDASFPLNGPVWSLFVELVANAAFAMGLWRLGRPQLLAVAALGACGVVTSASIWGSLDVGWNWSTFLGGLARVCSGFFLGVLLSRTVKTSGQLRSAAAIPALFAILTLLIVAPAPAALRSAYDAAFALVACPLLVAGGALVAAGPRLRPLCSFLGRISYPLYAIHYPIIGIVHYAAKALGVPTWLWMSLLLIGLVAASAWLEARFEPFAKRRLAALLARTKPASLAGA